MPPPRAALACSGAQSPSWALLPVAATGAHTEWFEQSRGLDPGGDAQKTAERHAAEQVGDTNRGTK